MLNAKIQDTIEYHTNRIAKTCKLDSQSTDDVRQELTLTALEAIKNYTDDINANLLTYVKAALNRGVAGIVRKIKNAPPIANADNMLDLEEIQDNYGRQADPDKPHQPLTISMKSGLEQLAVSPPEHDTELKLDIEAILRTFPIRYQGICRLLMEGYTQREIAKKFRVSRVRITQIIQHIRKILEKNSTGPLPKFPFLQLSTYREAPKTMWFE